MLILPPRAVGCKLLVAAEQINICLKQKPDITNSYDCLLYVKQKMSFFIICYQPLLQIPYVVTCGYHKYILL